MSKDKHDVLSYGLDNHVARNVTGNKINTKFELFYQNIMRKVSSLAKHDIDKIKTKLQSVCEKYHNVKTPYKHQANINNLSKNKDTVILKQEKGRGTIILNRSKYIEKYLSLLDCNQFRALYYDTTDSVERKIQRTLRIYKTIY